MDRIDSTQAQEHLELVDRILSESSRRLCAGGEFFVVWGVYTAVALVSWQVVMNGIVPPMALWLQAALLAAAVLFSIFRMRALRRNENRRSIVQREFLNMLWLTIGLAVVVNVAAFNIFSHWAAGAIWMFAEAVVVLFVGIHGNRRAVVAGIVIVASLVVANFVGTALAGYVMAAGSLLGYAGFGVAELLARD